jgi:hypothetical protein
MYPHMFTPVKEEEHLQPAPENISILLDRLKNGM